MTSQAVKECKGDVSVQEGLRIVLRRKPGRSLEAPSGAAVLSSFLDAPDPGPTAWCEPLPFRYLEVCSCSHSPYLANSERCHGVLWCAHTIHTVGEALPLLIGPKGCARVSGLHLQTQAASHPPADLQEGGLSKRLVPTPQVLLSGQHQWSSWAEGHHSRAWATTGWAVPDIPWLVPCLGTSQH